MEELFNKLRQNNIEVDIIDDNLKLSIPEDFNSDTLIEEVRLNKAAFLSFIKSHKAVQMSGMEKKERDRLLLEFNNTVVTKSEHETITSFFENQVVKDPEKIALFCEGREMSYNELNNKSNQLAHRLRQIYGVAPGSLIGIMMDRSEMMLVGILGILKSGAAYVPIEPTHPKARIEGIISDSDIKLIISDVVFPDDVFYEGEFINILIDENQTFSASNPPILNTPGDLCYVMYTSGSTGKPKGVMVSHHNVTNFFVGMSQQLSPTNNDCLLAVTNTSFDISVLELLWTLCHGVKVVIHPTMILDNLDRYVDKASKPFGITMMQSTPSFVNHLERDLGSQQFLKSLKVLLIGGEPILSSLVLKLKSLTNASIYNMYGPTETTIWSCMHQFTSADEKVFIGKPIANTRVYLLNPERELVALGETGELYIGGDGVSRGYWRRTELTSQMFLDDPFMPGERMYKTGDMARWTPDGKLEFLGRTDQQVKVRGFRIELGEIEHHLAKYAGITEAVVSVNVVGDEKRIVAYYISNVDQEATTLRQYLSEVLPEYMIPSFYVRLPLMPMTANGKVDRKALPDIEMKVENDHVQPSNVIEEGLVEIWGELLKRDKSLISVNKTFFELGGHSLLSIQVVQKMYTKFGLYIPLKTFFQLARVDEIARYIKIMQQREEPQSEFESIDL